MDTKNLENSLGELLENLINFYKDKTKTKDLSSQEQKNLIQLLKDNNISIERKKAPNILSSGGSGASLEDETTTGEEETDKDFDRFLEEAGIV